MATVNKDFRVKHGLVVEGSTATVNGSNVLTEAKTEFLQDTTAAMFTGGTHGDISFTYDDDNGVINATVTNAPTFDTQIVFEGSTVDSYQTTLTVTDPTDDRTITLPDATTTLVGDNTSQTLSNKTIESFKLVGDSGGVTGVLDSDGKAIITIGGYYSPVANAVNNIDVLNAATGNAPSISAIGTDTNINLNLAGKGTGVVQAGGVEVVTISGTQTLTNKTITSPSISSLYISDSSIVFEGTANAHETTLTVADPTDDRTLTLPDATDTLVGRATTDTLSNKSISLGSNTVTGTVAQFNTALSDGDFATLAGTETLTNKSISGASNTLTNIPNNALSNSSITINGFSISLGGSATYGTDNIGEGSTNLYFTNERAQDAVGNAVGNGLDYDDGTGAISVDPAEFALNAVGAPTGNVSMATYKITSLGTPTDGTDAATKAYVDSVTEGLHIHESVVAATTANVSLANDLENGDTLDGITLATGNRILVKNQTTQSENGIYVVQASGQPVRATDFDTATEVDSGDFVFVYSGTVNASTGWVQTNKPATIGTDAIVFTQFSGAGTYLAGNGLTLTGSTFSINTAITADLSTAQTLTNKTLTTPTIGSFVNAGHNHTDASNGGTLTSAAITDFTEAAQDAAALMITSGTHTNITVSYNDSAGTLSLTGAVTYTDENARDAIGAALTAGSGVSVTVNDGADTITVANTGVLSITGTANQVTASASTGDITLSLPQNIHSGATPTFSSINLGSVALTDALLGSATQSLTDGTATVIDSWSATTYNSAKYLVQMKKGTDIHVIEVLATVDGNNNVYLTEYAEVISNASIGTTDADYSSGNVRLLVTASNGTTVKVHKTLIEA